MSHFTTMVKILNSEVEELGLNDALAKKMAPYQENNMGDCPEGFLAFNDAEDECRKEWETEGTEMVRMPDGRILYTWDDLFKVKSRDPFENKHVLPPGLKEEMVLYKEKYPTFQEFMEDFHGYENGPDKKTGRYGHWENPNAKWDWFAIGGRWMGQLRLKNRKANAVKGDPGLMTHFDDDPLTADAVQYKGIDWAAMDAEVDGEIEDFYKDVEILRELEAKEKAGKKLTDAERSKMSDLMFGARWRLCDIGLVNRDAEGRYDSIKDFTLEDLKRDYRCEWGFRSFAAIDEQGKWHEKGTMGWFGCHSGTEEDAVAWARGFKEHLLDGTDPDTWLVMVDCHI